MIFDLITLIPFGMLFNFRYSRLFFLIKCTRLLKSLSILNPSAAMDAIKKFFKKDEEECKKIEEEI